MENKKEKKKFEPKMESVDKAMGMVSMGSVGKTLAAAKLAKGNDTAKMLNTKRGDMPASQQSESKARQEVLKKLKEDPSFFDNLDPKLKELANKVIGSYKK